MKLPNARYAYIPKDKLFNYLLSETHPVGKFKAKFFGKIGFNETNANKLEKVLLTIALQNNVEDTKDTAYGTNFTIQSLISLPNHPKATIKTVWFIETGTTKPRFVTAIPGIIYTEKRKL